MLTFHIKNVKKIKTNQNVMYDSITYDGKNFYVTVPHQNEIRKYGHHFSDSEEISVKRSYRCISYDQHYKCFWATAEKENNKIYKLNEEFCEIDCIIIKSNTPIKIRSLSCDCCREKLMLICHDSLFLLDKCTNSEPMIVQRGSRRVRYNSVTSLCDCYLTSYNNNTCNLIAVYTYCNEKILECRLPGEYYVIDMTSLCCMDECFYQKPMVYILAKTKNELCLLTCVISCCDNKPCHYNNECLHRCLEIMQSIAYVEASISHILNAEGEKIQKVVECSNKVCDLLCVNESVNKTIVNMIHLEQVLYSKLQTVHEICPEICELCKYTHKCGSHKSNWHTCDDEIQSVICCDIGDQSSVIGEDSDCILSDAENNEEEITVHGIEEEN